MEREVRECKTSDKDGGYFSMEGDVLMLISNRIWKKGVASCLRLKLYKLL